MRKHTLVLLFLAFVLGSFAVISPNVAQANNCAYGDFFDSNTGLFCYAFTQYNRDCAPGDFFSSVTGRSCGGVDMIYKNPVANTTAQSSVVITAPIANAAITATQSVPTPTVNISIDISGSNTGLGNSTAILWSSTNATTCTGSDGANGWTGSKALSGIFPSGNLTNTTKYSITCTNEINRLNRTTSPSVSASLLAYLCTNPYASNNGGLLPCLYKTSVPTSTPSCNASIYWGVSPYYPQTTLSYGGSAQETWSVQGADQVWGDCGDGSKMISTGPQSYTFGNLVNNRTCRVWGVIGSNTNACDASATIYVNR